MTEHHWCADWSETTIIGGKVPWRIEKKILNRLNANPQAQDSTPESKHRNSYLLVTLTRLIWTL